MSEKVFPEMFNRGGRPSLKWVMLFYVQLELLNTRIHFPNRVM